MARPRKAEADRSGAPFAIRLTTAERDRLTTEARRLRVPSVSALVRQRALTGSVTVTATQELAAPDRVALNRIGVNLNQIARVLNQEGMPVIDELADELRTTLAQLNAVLLRGAGHGPEPL